MLYWYTIVYCISIISIILLYIDIQLYNRVIFSSVGVENIGFTKVTTYFSLFKILDVQKWTDNDRKTNMSQSTSLQG